MKNNNKKERCEQQVEKHTYVQQKTLSKHYFWPSPVRRKGDGLVFYKRIYKRIHNYTYNRNSGKHWTYQQSKEHNYNE